MKSLDKQWRYLRFLLLRLQRKTKNQEEGFILLLTVSMILVLLALLGTYSLVSRLEQATARASFDSNSGFYNGEAGLNQRAEIVRQIFLNQNTPQGTAPSPPSWQTCATGSGTALGTLDYACTKYTFPDANFPGGQRIAYTYMTTDPKNPNPIVIGPGELFQGLNASEFRYTVFSTPLGLQNKPSAILNMNFKSRVIPLFQFAAFYTNDLEIAPSPNMSLVGPVHTNGDLYFNSNGGNGITLQFGGTISAVGTIYRGQKTNNNCGGGGAVIDTFPGVTTSLACNGNTRTTITPTTSDAQNNRIVNVPQALTVPAPGQFLPQPTSPYWSSADLRIVLNLDNAGNPQSIQIQTANSSPDNTRTNNLLLNAEVPNAVKSPLICPYQGSNPIPANCGTYGNNATKLYVMDVSGFNVGDQLVIKTTLVPGGYTYSYYNDLTIQSIDTTKNSITLAKPLSNITTPISTQFINLLTTATGYQGYNTNSTPAVPPTAANCSTGTPPANLIPKYPQPNGVCGANSIVEQAIVSSNSVFHNNREGKDIRMLNVNVQNLMDAIQQQQSLGNAIQDTDSTTNKPKALNDATDAGLVWYFTILGPNSNGNTANNYGVRLINGANLQSSIAGALAVQGLTVVTDQAAYTQGDYNVDINRPLNVPPVLTNGSNTIPKIPASILADSFNVLSNNWIDLPQGQNCSAANPNFRQTGQKPYATNTTLYVALLSGTDYTGGQNGSGGQNGAYNGGLENYPRFHEDWQPPNNVNNTNQLCLIGLSNWLAGSPLTGAYTPQTTGGVQTLYYTGSFISLGTPNHVKGGWGSQTYSPPNRVWAYDTTFNNAQKLPPLTPKTVYLRQELFSRDFN